MPKVLIIGESGQLAQSLKMLHWPTNHRLAFHGRRALGSNVDPDRVRDLVQAENPHLVLNAAAYTAVDRAESEPAAALTLNAALPHALATACAALDIPLVHVSTDYVFDGGKIGSYDEADTPSPLNVYGSTKLAGDRHIERVAAGFWAILRTSWVFSEIGDSFPVKLLRRARAGEVLRVVDDQIGCPTPASELARAMQAIGDRLLDRDPDAHGLFNCCGAAAMSWHGFADRLLQAAEARGLARAPLQPIPSGQFRTAARRPRNSVLNCARIERQCGLRPADPAEEVTRITRAILAR